MTTRWMTVDEAAEYIRVKDKRVLIAAIKAGDLPASNSGKNNGDTVQGVRLTAEDVDAWLRGRPFNG